MFNTKISLYGIMILLALLANIIVVVTTYKKYIFSKDEIMGALIYENIGIIFGAKILTYLQNIDTYGEIDFLSLGFSSYGAVIGAITCLIIFGLQFKKSSKDMLFTFMPTIPFMYALGKIGCFLAGCCHGIEYDGLGNVVYLYSEIAPSNVHLFPVQILETVAFLFIFIYMITKIHKNTFTWSTLGISFILCGTAKFSLDYLRASHTGIFLSTNQIISIIFVIIGICIFIKNQKRTLSRD